MDKNKYFIIFIIIFIISEVIMELFFDKFSILERTIFIVAFLTSAFFILKRLST